jgi:predicted O-methyltransferase YrrM
MITNIANTEFPFNCAANFSEFKYNQLDIDIQGWGGNHPIFAELIRKKSPKMVCDVGVWKGQSTINMAKCLRDNGMQSLVFAVDTFLGSPQMWYDNADWRKSLKLVHGYPTYYYTFLANVFNSGVENFVVPVPATTYSAYLMFAHSNIKFDLIHIDAEHEYSAVKNDIENYWNLLNDDGVMICDDYSSNWPGVVKAVDEFVEIYKLKFEKHDYKAVIYK